MSRHYNIVVKGFVQGVSYRFATLNKALELGLSGFVKNAANGDVYIEAEGAEENINKLIEWCYVGPTQAKVTEVQAQEADLKGYRNFELKR
ncbi:MAG: acylphosphatase [Bacteroidetes bacterium]|nr:acylphosphatase [Bacteroidota bacterium]